MRFHHHSLRALGALAALAFAAAPPIAAQDATPFTPQYTPRFDIATYAGASIPTGTLRDDFDNGFLLGAQATYGLRTHVGVLGSFDWTHPTTRLVATDAGANVYQADLGLELGGARGNMTHWALRPFMDLGGGLRHYDFASTDLSNRTRGVGFASLGTEVAVGRSSLRLAATDNVLSYEAPTADATRATRNDVGLTLGFTFHP
jgi:hypothetical protein